MMSRLWLVYLFLLGASPTCWTSLWAADGAEIYTRIVPSVVWIHSERSQGTATGSGALVDVKKRLVLTNYHVVYNNPRAKVFFPIMRRGEPVSEKTYYIDRAKRLAIEGRVVALDKSADLALIQLNSLPKDVAAVPLAKDSPKPGATVHNIGSAGKSGALFGYVKGTVRQVYQKKWKAEIAPRKIALFDAKVIETDSPTNPGDSGGPLLNDDGELVGVTQGGAINAQLVSYFVDLSEVRALLKSARVDVNSGTLAKKRTVPLTIQDQANLFSPETISQQNKLIAALYARGFDVYIETAATAPEKYLKQLDQANQEERLQLFQTWLREQMTTNDVHGLGIIICKKPQTLYVDVSPILFERLPARTSTQIRDLLISHLRERKFDQALVATIAEIEKIVKQLQEK